MTNVKIFGEHDDRTKEQMARCMQYGSAVGGVLCADGHLGYAQPVGGDLDEAPQAYRRLPDVLARHAGTVRIEHTLRPFSVVMAGADVFDPFKD